MIVEAIHPAWRRHRPRGARALRDSLVTVASQVRLRTVGDRGLVRVGEFVPRRPAHDRKPDPPTPRPVAELDGRRFVEVHAAVVGGASRPVRPEELALYLGNDSNQTLATWAFNDMFAGTPVRELHGSASMSGSVRDERGVAIDADRDAEVARDGTDEARASLQAFLDGAVLVSDGRVWERFRPVARLYGSGWPGDVAVGLERGIDLGGRPPFAAHGLAAAVRLVQPDAEVPDDLSTEDTLAAIRLKGSDADPTWDVDSFVRYYAGVATLWLRSHERTLRRDGGDLEAHAALCARFAPVHMQARIGGDPEGGLAEAARGILGVIAHIEERRPAHRWSPDQQMVRAYLTAVALPRYASATVLDADDAQALSGLGR